ncbi:hypothetical protein BGV60_11170 [Burkholderia ubonensis]|nr:hypothetical protein BGV59_07805 [Burkholderia ubonensis]OJB55220.1 hypothetical protein BGV60_11170 [Burkholderia ubonensis]
MLRIDSEFKTMCFVIRQGQARFDSRIRVEGREGNVAPDIVIVRIRDAIFRQGAKQRPKRQRPVCDRVLFDRDSNVKYPFAFFIADSGKSFAQPTGARK